MQKVRELRKKSRPALGGVVGKLLEAVAVHQRQHREMAPLEAAVATAGLDGGEFAAQDLHEKIAGATGGLQEPRADPVGLVVYELEHLFHQPAGREDLAVITDAPLRFDEIAHDVRFALRRAR